MVVITIVLSAQSHWQEEKAGAIQLKMLLNNAKQLAITRCKRDRVDRR